MKKIIAILLCISALFALGACGRLTEVKSESVKPEVYFTEDKSGTYTDSEYHFYRRLVVSQHDFLKFAPGLSVARPGNGLIEGEFCLLCVQY